MSIKYVTLLFIASMFFSGCLTSTKTTDKLSEIGSNTCISATAIAFDGIQVQFAVPSDAISFVLKRNGEVILETDDRSETSFTDSGLIQGQTYRYRCLAVLDVNDGLVDLGQQLTVTLEASTPPTFDGIKSVTPLAPDQVRVEWDLSSDQIISHYKVFKHIGNTSDVNDFSSTPVTTITDLTLKEFIVPNLGDQINYSFRVVACNSSDICDSNTEILSTTLPDTGPPTTSGATAINVLDGKVNLTVPWSDSNGQISRRRIFRTSVATGVACPTVFGLYGNVNDVVIIEPKDTPTNLVASGVLSEGSKYCFIVRDVDSLNQSELNMAIQSVEIGDLTPPSFTSSVSLTRDVASPEDTLVASWIAMLRESDDPIAGASEYNIYISSAIHPAIPDSDPCANGSLTSNSPVSASSYPSGSNVSVNLTGLSPRNNYRICVRARDTSSNISSEAPKALQSTGDATAPAFAGIQSLAFSNLTGRLEYTFIVPAATDIRDYKVTTIRTRGGVVNTPIVLTKTFTGLVAGQTVTKDFTLAEAGLIDNDSVTVRVDVCDNASPDFNSADNCTATAAEETLSVPDATAPADFSGLTLAELGTSHRSIKVNWAAPASWIDYVGFKVYYVDGGALVGLNSSNCLCASNDCATNPITSCEVSQTDAGAFLDPSRQYEVYVSAFDLVGNQTTQYIPYTGLNKITGTTKANDTVAPNFNANFTISYESGAKILFNAAIDDQFQGAPDNLDITYQVYRKEGSTFLCPSSPESSSGGCDGLSPFTTLMESALSEEGGKLVYTDTSVVDGVNYFYQFCAIDDALNRQCQTGAVGNIDVLDVTIPTIDNLASSKVIGGGTNWTVSFDVADNAAAYNQLIVKVFKSATAYPSESNPGVPIYETGAGTVTVNPSTGAASFNDNGPADVESAYYLIQVQDLNGNKGFAQFRDMPPAPVITSVVWDAPLFSDGNPFHDTLISESTYGVTINGSNLSNIASINSGGSAANADDISHCQTSHIVSQTDSQIRCTISGTVDYDKVYNLYFKDSVGRDFIHASGSPTSYCSYAALNGISDLRGLGTSNRRYVLCSPDQIKQIGRNADNPNNSEDIIGFFVLGKNIDFAGVTDFKGIPSMQADEFYLEGFGNEIQNLTIDTSATNEDAAFLLGCTGVTNSTSSIVHNVVFKDAIIKTGTGRGAVLTVDKSCIRPTESNAYRLVKIINSEIHSDNTAGFIAAEFTSSGDRVNFSLVEDSNLYSTRPDNTTAVGGFFGKLTALNSGVTSKFTRLELNNVSLNPRQGGPTDAGYNIGGLAGRGGFSYPVDFEDCHISGGLTINGGMDYVGGLFGVVSKDINGLRVIDSIINGVNISATGSSQDNRGGIIGGVEVVLFVNKNIEFDSVQIFNSNVSGGANIGGMVGDIGETSNVVINSSRLIDSSVTGSGTRIGGLIGRAGRMSDSSISNADLTYSTVTSTGSQSVGGFIGEVSFGENTSISDSYLFGVDVNALGSTFVGGIIGYTFRSTNLSVERIAIGKSSINGNNRVGGLVGWVRNGIDSSFVNNSIQVKGVNGASPSVKGNNFVGGLFGDIGHELGVMLIENNAVYGKVKATDASSSGTVFGIMFELAPEVQINNNYYRNDFTGINVITTNPENENVNEIEGKTVSELEVQATYVNWDFTNTWEMQPTGHKKAKLQIFNGLNDL